MQIEGGDDFVEPLLVRTVGDDHDLQVAVPVVRDELVEDVGEQLRAFLHRIEARGPEEDRRVRDPA